MAVLAPQHSRQSSVACSTHASRPRVHAGAPADGAFYGNGSLFVKQLLALAVTIGMAVVGTTILYWLLFLLWKLCRQSIDVPETVRDMVDMSVHGESAYRYALAKMGAATLTAAPEASSFATPSGMAICAGTGELATVPSAPLRASTMPGDGTEMTALAPPGRMIGYDKVAAILQQHGIIMQGPVVADHATPFQTAADRDGAVGGLPRPASVASTQAVGEAKSGPGEASAHGVMSGTAVV